ncbi:rod shape-determining protein MreD [Spirochaeta africana]|uniref:Cell shape-determining protein n=1 Tax=Spirochaeta africana (strain ATCC 700263 / DSM 8902 / Z-7692) TaxID=889378 RepID=H9UJ72_SPIAZ|nr:rod shape-determining protein MreD [Spirochaeta africana]AFG37565.1 cell shape-determining protein [Spirochaeta africana DSM 8902]
MITRILLNTIVLALIVFVMTTWGNIIELGGIKPDIVLIVVVWMALHQGAYTSQISGAMAGGIEDFLSLAPFGFHLTARTLLGFLTGSVREFVGLDRLVMPVLFTLAAFGIQAVWLTMVSAIFSIDTARAPLFSLAFLYGALYTAALAPAIFLAADGIRAGARRFRGRF